MLVSANFALDLLTYSTSIFFCIILIPFYAVRKVFRWYIYYLIDLINIEM